MVAGGNINSHLAIIETLLETGPVFFRFLFYLRFVLPPASIHDVARIQGKVRAIFLKVIKKPVERFFPSRLGVTDVPVEDALNISALFNVDDEYDAEYPIFAAPILSDNLSAASTPDPVWK